MTTPSVAEAVEAAREVDLTTFGRTTGNASRRTLWITTDSNGRLYIRSGMGPSRDWPRNLLANQRAVLHIGERALGPHVVGRTSRNGNAERRERLGDGLGLLFPVHEDDGPPARRALHHPGGGGPVADGPRRHRAAP